MRSANLGKISADIRPDLSKNNPRNSEGAFFTLKNGDILFAYSKFKGNSNADYASADICLLRSTDDGRTFGEEKTIVTCESEKAVNIMSLSLPGDGKRRYRSFLSGTPDLYPYADVPQKIRRWRKYLERPGALHA